MESTAERVRELGREALPLVVDVTRVEQADRMVSRTLEEFGRVDILINNAAMPIGRDRVSTADLDPDVFQRVLDVKVRGTYLCARAVIPPLIRQGDGGKIVNVASSAGKRGAAEALAYCAANFAQVGMTQSLAQELGPHRVNVQLHLPRRRRHVTHGPVRPGRTVEKDGRVAPHRTHRDPGRSGRLYRLSVHSCGFLDPRPVHQHRRRNGHGALRNSPPPGECQ